MEIKIIKTIQNMTAYCIYQQKNFDTSVNHLIPLKRKNVKISYLCNISKLTSSKKKKRKKIKLWQQFKSNPVLWKRNRLGNPEQGRWDGRSFKDKAPFTPALRLSFPSYISLIPLKVFFWCSQPDVNQREIHLFVWLSPLLLLGVISTPGPF